MGTDVEFNHTPNHSVQAPCNLNVYNGMQYWYSEILNLNHEQ